MRMTERRGIVRIDRDAPRRFLHVGYQPGDWVAVFLKSYDTGETAQRVRPVSAVIAPRFQAWLRFRNAARWNVYVSVNAVAPGRSRTRDAIAAIRHVVLDVDRDGPRVLADLAVRRDLPTPSYVLHTSPARVHLLWRVQGFGAERVEALQRRLARQLGADAAATSCAQMTRLPGFVNYKHEPPHLVTVDERAATSLYAPMHFPRPPAAPSFNAPSIRLVSAAVPVIKDPLARARRFLARAPPAIAGQHGDGHTFRICCRLIRGFGLSDDETLAVLGDWNARCRPPWSDADLLGKVSHARRYGREPVGGLLTGHARHRDRIARTGWS